MRLHEYERSLGKDKTKFLEWRKINSTTIYNLKKKTVTIEPMFDKLSRKEKLEIMKTADYDIIKSAIAAEQQQFETKIIELHKRMSQ